MCWEHQQRGCYHDTQSIQALCRPCRPTSLQESTSPCQFICMQDLQLSHHNKHASTCHILHKLAFICEVWHVLVQVQVEAKVAFDGILQRQALLEKARQDQQLAVRFTSVLGFPSRLQALCKSRQYSQILPAYEHASALIQSQIQAVSNSNVDWGVLQTLINQVSCASLHCVHAVLSAERNCRWLQLLLSKFACSALHCHARPSQSFG